MNRSRRPFTATIMTVHRDDHDGAVSANRIIESSGVAAYGFRIRFETDNSQG